MRNGTPCMDRQLCPSSLTEHTMSRISMSVCVVLLVLASGAHAWGGLFNRFSSDMLANLGMSRSPYKHYPYGQMEPDEVYAEALEGNRIDDVMDNPVECYNSQCGYNGDCCPGFICMQTAPPASNQLKAVDTATITKVSGYNQQWPGGVWSVKLNEDGGHCLPGFSGRKVGEICSRENQCDAGLICEEVVPGEMHVCRPPTSGHKQYNEDCNTSSECDVTRSLCCIMQRRHRQKPRKSCGYFKEPLVCIGPVATDQVREYVQHTAGEKRIGVYRLH